MDSELKEYLKELKGEIQKVNENVKTENKKTNDNLNEKFDSLKTKLSKIENQLTIHENKIKIIEKEQKKRNFIIHGLETNERNYYELEERVLKILKETLLVNIETDDIDFIHRIGQQNKMNRPIIVGMISFRNKMMIMQNKNKLRDTNIYITNDWPDYVRESRKEFLPVINLLRKNGENAIIRQDKLIYNGQMFNNTQVSELLENISKNIPAIDKEETPKPNLKNKRQASSEDGTQSDDILIQDNAIKPKGKVQKVKTQTNEKRRNSLDFYWQKDNGSYEKDLTNFSHYSQYSKNS